MRKEFLVVSGMWFAVFVISLILWFGADMFLGANTFSGSDAAVEYTSTVTIQNVEKQSRSRLVGKVFTRRTSYDTMVTCKVEHMDEPIQLTIDGKELYNLAKDNIGYTFTTTLYAYNRKFLLWNTTGYCFNHEELITALQDAK